MMRKKENKGKKKLKRFNNPQLKKYEKFPSSNEEKEFMTLCEALNEIDIVLLDSNFDGFIGFVNDNGIFIQFARNSMGL